MTLKFVAGRIKALILLFFGMVRRALCCFRRHRRNSCTPIPLTAVGVVPDNPTDIADKDSWNTWEENPVSVVTERMQNSVQQQIEMYRAARQASSDSDKEQESDFFQDMAPKITRQPKILLPNGEPNPAWNNGTSTRLSLAPDPVSFTSSELGAWEDSSGWEDEAEWDPDGVLKEKRQLERQRRQAEQQQRRQEREYLRGMKSGGLGSKLS